MGASSKECRRRRQTLPKRRQKTKTVQVTPKRHFRTTLKHRNHMNMVMWNKELSQSFQPEEPRGMEISLRLFSSHPKPEATSVVVRDSRHLGCRGPDATNGCARLHVSE